MFRIIFNKNIGGFMESLRELYKIGVEPSSSHTMGPQKAAFKIKETYQDANHYEVYYMAHWH